MFAEQLRRAVEASPRVELARVAQLLWKAYAAGQVTEAQASELSDLIESRRALLAPPKPLRRRLGSRPRTTGIARTAPALGRLRSPAAGLSQPVHHSRDRRAGCRCGRASEAW